jgi:hypothetical protein
MYKRIGSKARRLSAQSSSLLLGLALSFLLTQSAFLCSSGILSAFGWALLATLAGCLYTTIFQWNDLIRSRVPEQTTWRKGVASGILLAGGLFALGHALKSGDGSPWPALGLAFVPWCRAAWRRLFTGDTLNTPKEKITSLIMITSAVVFIFPELAAVSGAVLPYGFQAFKTPDALTGLPAIPRSTAILSGLLIAAASSLQRPQDRTIPTRTFWTIPVGVSAILLSTCGWIAMNASGTRGPVMGHFEALPVHRLLTLCPALLFGIVMLGIRPHCHIRNAQKIGKENVYWWQLLGLSAGILFSLLLLRRPTMLETDALSLGLMLLAQIGDIVKQRSNIRFAPALSSVPQSVGEEPALNSRQI